MSITINLPILLAGEGKDEKNFFGALIGHLGLESIQVEDLGGATQLRNRLEALVKSPNFHTVTSLGITRDADANAGAAFQSVCAALHHVGLPVPDRPLVAEGDSPRVVLMILPDGVNPGMLEDLCLQSVQKDAAMGCVQDYFECLENRGPMPRNLSKAKVQVFLGSREKPAVRLGEAALQGHWPWDDPTFDQTKQFIQSLVD